MSNPKTMVNEQFARTSSNGVRTNPSNANDDGIAPLADYNGRLWVNVYGFVPPPIDPFPNKADFQSANINSAGFTPISGSLRMGAFEGYVRAVTTFPCWFYCVDGGIGAGTAPTIIIPVNANQRLFSYAIPFDFATSLSFGLSSTELTFTAVVGASFAISGVVYRP